METHWHIDEHEKLIQTGNRLIYIHINRCTNADSFTERWEWRTMSIATHKLPTHHCYTCLYKIYPVAGGKYKVSEAN